ncbi:MAG: hypothetical protein WB562_05170, partial [Candidatus Sulfotelmatobacter sp.]
MKSILRSLFVILLFTAFAAAQQSKQSAWHTFSPQSATGATQGWDVSFTGAYLHSISLTVTGAPSTCTYKLQGSVDGTIWMDLSPATACTSSTVFQAGPAAVNQVRGNLVSLSGGTSPTVTATYVGVNGATTNMPGVLVPQGVSLPNSGNNALLWGWSGYPAWQLPAAGAISRTINNLSITVLVADNSSNVYDFAVYNSSGTRIAHGSAAGSALTVGWNSVALAASGTVTDDTNPRWYLATTNCASSCAVFAGIPQSVIYAPQSFGITSAGTAPSSITPPSTTSASVPVVATLGFQ